MPMNSIHFDSNFMPMNHFNNLSKRMKRSSIYSFTKCNSKERLQRDIEDFQ